MRKTTIGGVERSISANAWTTIVYDRAFGGKHALHEDVNAFMRSSTEPLTVLPLESALRLEYAFERSTAGALFQDYDAWLRSQPVEMMDQVAAQSKDGWMSVLFEEIIATFFPSLARADVDAPGTGGDPQASAGAGEQAGAPSSVEGA